ncbi:MAG TPA: FUSC family protein [Ktedonobacterales bacterium]|nr:FUSC family protein [Ktedonobacterales bacterium]
MAAVRAAGTAVVAGAAWGSGIAYPHWAPIIVILSVRPDEMVALRLTTQRVIGTVLAAGLTAIILHVVPDPVVLAGLAVGAEFLAVTIKYVNFTCFVFFLTLPLLLLSRPTQGPAHAALRVATTVVGAGVALGISAFAAWLARRATVPPRRPPEPLPGSAAL